MSILKIVEWPSAVLETKAKEVTIFDKELAQLVADMQETLKDSGGIGLAANQVGVLKRVLIIHIPYSTEDERQGDEKKPWHNKMFVIINPEIISRSSEKTKMMEGCLSFPEVFDFVDRHACVKVKAKNEKGEDFEFDADGLFSICVQHEIDHLDGIVFFKRMSRLKANLIRKQVMKRRRNLESS